jgi:uncharacterized membrane protein
MQGLSARAQGMDMSKGPQVMKDNMMRMQANKLEKCYGINAAAKNDCVEGAFVRRSSRASPRSEIVRAATGGRLRQDPGWKNVAVTTKRVAAPSAR